MVKTLLPGTIVIAVDYDGALTYVDEYPKTGHLDHELVRMLTNARGYGAKIILWTNREGKELQAALEQLSLTKLKFDAINDNLPELISIRGRNPRKIWADIYLDDKAVTDHTQLAMLLEETLNIPAI